MNPRKCYCSVCYAFKYIQEYICTECNEKYDSYSIAKYCCEVKDGS